MTSAASDRSSVTALIGGLVWALLPVWDLLAIEGISELLFFVLPPILIGIALIGLHRRHREAHSDAYGRLGRVGFVVSLLGLGLMAAGNAMEVVWLALRGREHDVGHLLFFAGFILVALPGAVMLGLAIRRARLLPHANLAGLLLILNFPATILFGAVGGALAPPESDLGFWLALATPYGLTWVVLGWILRVHDARFVGDPSPA